MHPPLRAGTQTLSVETMKLKEFFIPFSGLKLGKHEFVYKIDNSFRHIGKNEQYDGTGNQGKGNGKCGL